MTTDNILKEIDIKNCTCCYFDDIVNINDLNLNNILLDEKSCKNILLYGFTCKSIYRGKPLLLIFNKIEGYIRKNDSTKYLALHHTNKK